MERKQVTNGCNGGCCASFTLPVSMNDLQRMRESNRENEIECDNGYKRWPLEINELDKLLEMLIPLGRTTIDPQYNQDISELKDYNPEIHTPKDVLQHTSGHNFVVDGKVYTEIFTCKHYDTENKVCLNYENRPNICKNFGKRCGYAGCKFDENLFKEQLKFPVPGSII